MRKKAIRMAKLILGWTFIVLGVLGLFLPILQGVLFLIIGLVILAQEQHWAHRLLERLRHRFPHMASSVDHARHRAEDWVHRIVHRRRDRRPETCPDPEPPGQ